MEMLKAPPAMPDDLTLNPEHNRRLHSKFNALSALTRYRHGLERAKRVECERVLEHRYMPGAMAAARAELGKDATLAEVKIHARQTDDGVRRWLDRAERHRRREVAWRVFFEIYETNVAVLSRDFSMADAELHGRRVT